MQSVQSQEENERIELEYIEVLLVLGYVRSTTLRIYWHFICRYPRETNFSLWISTN